MYIYDIAVSSSPDMSTAPKVNLSADGGVLLSD